MKPNKHVIILGAGASITSGYPDANRLAILMCDEGSFMDELTRVAELDGEPEMIKWMQQKSTVSTYYQSFSNAVQLLRCGDFATMDELSNLARDGAHAGEILKLKKLMRFVFALNNPEFHHWATSDYRLLIQKLFEGGSQLRADVAILSFNYDPYLEYRLRRAQRSREIVQPLDPEISRNVAQAVTSGFIYPSSHEWLQAAGFCHLKLHGTAVLPPNKTGQRLSWPPQQNEWIDLITDRMFGFSIVPRLACLADKRFADQDPPALLPWEIISRDGNLLSQQEFESVTDPNWQHKSLYPLFKGIWERAREEVQQADKISFVGLSVGRFMEPELRYLFARKKNITRGVIANPECAKYTEYENPFHPVTMPGRLLDVLHEIAPGICFNRSERDLRRRGDTEIPLSGSAITPREASTMTLRIDFRDFIQNEL